MFRFTLRELLLLMLIVGEGFGWFVDRRTLVGLNQHKSQEAEAAEMKTYALQRILERDGYSVDWTQEESHVVVKTPVDSSYLYPIDEPRTATEL